MSLLANESEDALRASSGSTDSRLLLGRLVSKQTHLGECRFYEYLFESKLHWLTNSRWPKLLYIREPVSQSREWVTRRRMLVKWYNFEKPSHNHSLAKCRQEGEFEMGGKSSRPLVVHRRPARRPSPIFRELPTPPGTCWRCRACRLKSTVLSSAAWILSPNYTYLAISGSFLVRLVAVAARSCDGKEFRLGTNTERRVRSLKTHDLCAVRSRAGRVDADGDCSVGPQTWRFIKYLHNAPEF